MFRSAYIRLSVWYVAILMGLSLTFSVWLYQEAMQEVRASFSGPAIERLQNRFGPLSRDELQQAISEQYTASQQRVLLNLTVLNIGVLVVGGAASYALARRTMRPIEQAVIAQNRFTADASHELRTPLAAMKTEIEVALRDPNLTKADIKELLTSNLEEIDRMSDLAQGLLTLARSDERPELRAINPRPIVEEVCQRLQPLADAKRITIKKECADFKIMAEDKSISTVAGILLDNAIKYSPANSTITVSTKRADNNGLIVVADQGPGISAADLPHIFDRFYRADTSRSTQHVSGHGLGLSIAKKIADSLHGAIIARSDKGKGSTFTLRVPLAQ